jgi:nicotinate-nucleotide adenylyltransferase
METLKADAITPWPAPTGAPTLLFGGSFDPPHLAHTRLALQARDELFGEKGWLVYVPAARNPHKPTGPVATDAQRLEMLRLATQDAERVAIWTDELDRAEDDEASFWVDTITRAARVAGEGAVLRFLIGADQAIAFDRWHDHERILEYAEPAVMLRAPCPTREAFRAMLLSTGLDPAVWIPRLVGTEACDAASTDARNEIRMGNIPSGLVDPQVLGYIDLHGLYSE